MSDVSRPACPACESPKVWRILYGEPPPPEAWLEAYGTTELVVGGCLVSEGQLTHECQSCGNRFDGKPTGPENNDV